MFTIERLRAWEILDSRGRPTVQAECRLASGAEANASVPSGASTGRAEAVELRDGDVKRYGGLGCQRAVASVHEVLHPALAGGSFGSQAELDRRLIDLDGTPQKAKLGANALLSVSLAFARAAAHQSGTPLYQHFAELLGRTPRMPQLTVNLFSGGKPAGGQAPLQDVLLVPQSTRTVNEGLAMLYAAYQCAAELTARKYGMRLLRADEGRLAP